MCSHRRDHRSVTPAIRVPQGHRHLHETAAMTGGRLDELGPCCKADTKQQQRDTKLTQAKDYQEAQQEYEPLDSCTSQKTNTSTQTRTLQATNIQRNGQVSGWTWTMTATTSLSTRPLARRRMLKRRLTQAGNEEHMQSLRRSLQMFRSEFRRGLRQGNSYSGTTSREHTKSNTSNAQAERGRCGRKLLIPKILGTAAVKRERVLNTTGMGKNARNLDARCYEHLGASEDLSYLKVYLDLEKVNTRLATLHLHTDILIEKK